MRRWMMIVCGLAACGSGSSATDAASMVMDMASAPPDLARPLVRTCQGADSTSCGCYADYSNRSDSTMLCGGDNSVCCADSDYPSKPSTFCSCFVKPIWQCAADPSGTCWCQWDDPNNTLIFDESCRVGSTTGYDYCCVDTTTTPSSPDCSCYNSTKWGPPPCPTGTTQVDSCLFSTVIAMPAAHMCDAGKHVVSTCNGTPSSLGGIGDACTASSDCESGQCSNAGGGYCTRPCSINEDCAGNHQGTNQFGGPNFCVKQNASSNLCVPGCDYNNSACATQYGAGFDCYPLNDVYFCLHP